MRNLLRQLHTRRWAHLAVANLRILLGFAFLPAGLKKVLGQPFTDPANTGPFHDFLHAFHATGHFYQFVGLTQLLCAILLMTQTQAPLGALLTLPVITTIFVFCWSTGVVPTAVVVTLMLAGTVGLVVWDWERWVGVVRSGEEGRSGREGSAAAPGPEGLIDTRLWRLCGTGILVLYSISCIAYGGVYRPKGMDWREPAFYVLVGIAVMPVVVWGVEMTIRNRAAGR